MYLSVNFYTSLRNDHLASTKTFMYQNFATFFEILVTKSIFYILFTQIIDKVLC